MYVFIFLYFVRFFLVMRGDDWFIIWIGLEINILSFIIIIYKRYRQNSIESCMKYFFVQRLGSAMLLGIFYINKEVLGELILMVLSYKVGAAPMYFWFPTICRGIEWVSCFLLLSFQKVLPLILIIIFSSWVIWIIVVLRLILGTLGSFGQRNIKNLVAYSSIHHLGWIFLCNVFSDEVWIVYLILYSIIIFGIIIVLSNNEIIYFFIIDKWKNRMWFAFSILRIAGIPPMLGFFLKWIAFFFILRINVFYIIFIIFMSVIIFYVYFRVIYDVFIYNNRKMCSMKYLNKVRYIGVIDFVRIVGLVRGLGLMLVFFIW